MRIIRTLALGVAAAVFVWTAARALARAPAGHSPGGRSVGVRDGVKGRTDRVDDRADRKKGDRDAADKKQAKKPTDEKDEAADANEHGNKGGKLRGPRSRRSSGGWTRQAGSRERSGPASTVSATD